MKNRNFIGLFFCTCIFCFGFLINGNISLYFNIPGLLIVFGGTAGAAFLSFKTEQLLIVSKVLRANYGKQIKKETEIVHILIDLSIKSRIQGILSLQEEENETSILFLRRALGCLVDGYKGEQIRDILNTEITFSRCAVRTRNESFVRLLISFPPSESPEVWWDLSQCLVA